MGTKEQFISPVGRLVSGHPMNGNTKDGMGNDLRDKQGNPKTEYFMALAIPKDSPEWAAFQQLVNNKAIEEFPSLFNNGQFVGQKFSWKITDGDDQTVNTNGKRACDKEGYPGHWVVNFSSGFPSECWTLNGEQKIVDPEQIKKGYYIRIAGSCSGNDNQQQPGLYMNHNMVEFVAFGDVIQSGPDGKAVFGGSQAQYLPQGASQTPTGGGNIQNPGQQNGGFGGGNQQQQNGGNQNQQQQNGGFGNQQQNGGFGNQQQQNGGFGGGNQQQQNGGFGGGNQNQQQQNGGFGNQQQQNGGFGQQNQQQNGGFGGGNPQQNTQPAPDFMGGGGFGQQNQQQNGGFGGGGFQS